MKNKIYYNCVNALIAIGILSIPVSILFYILFESKIIESYINPFNILVAGVVTCILSFVVHFILTKTSAYKRIGLMYKEAHDIDFELTLEGEIESSLDKKMSGLSYRKNDLPGFKNVYINEQLLQNGKRFSRVIYLTDFNDKPFKLTGQLDTIIRKYYSDNSIEVEGITGVVCFKAEGKKAGKYKMIKDYFNYDTAKNIVSQFVLCAVDTKEKLIYFNNDNITGKRTIPLRMITDILGKERNS